MRWFKHLTDSWVDEKLSYVVAEYGLEIYGFWWRLLEIIGKQMDGSEKTSCEYSDKVWANFCGTSVKSFQKFSKILEEQELIFTKNGEKLISIDIPNLLKYRDEYSIKKSKKSG